MKMEVDFYAWNFQSGIVEENWSYGHIARAISYHISVFQVTFANLCPYIHRQLRSLCLSHTVLYSFRRTLCICMPLAVLHNIVLLVLQVMSRF